MRGPRFLVAKYLPDLARVEPRNVGIIVWTPGGVEARFAAEKSDRPGVVDGRSIPSFVSSPSAYRQWIAFWRTEMDRPEIEPIGGGPRVARSAPEFLDVLADSGRGNFLLADGGYALDPVEPEGLHALADHLFGLLVSMSGPEEPRDVKLDDVCNSLIKRSGLIGDPHFKPGHTIECTLPKGISGIFEFNYFYGNGSPLALYQRLPLSRSRKSLNKEVNDSAWKFSQVLKAGIVTEDHTGVLVLPTPDQRENSDVRNALDVIGSVTRVLNLNDFEAVRSEFSALPSLLGH